MIDGQKSPHVGFDGGIYYEEPNELIFIGGEFDKVVLNIVDCYDINKDEWNMI